MLSERGFIGSGGRVDRCWVERTALLSEVDSELARAGIVVLCAPWGYGKTSLLHDYARMAHVRSVSRPIVRVDFEAFEAQMFMIGNHVPLLSSLRRLVARAGAGVDEPRFKLRKLPSRHSSAATHCVYEMIAALAPAWRLAYEKGFHLGEESFEDLPLVTIDNVPRLDEIAWAKLADALATWASAGVRVIMACEPSAFPRSLFPGATVVGPAALGVSVGELALWDREMHFLDAAAAYDASGGVPFLLGACRSSLTHDIVFDEAFLRASEKVLAHCLDEPMCAGAERARCAMAMLCRGSLGDLELVGAPLRGDELAILAETYPFFGIDTAKGTFSCIRVGCSAPMGAMARIVSSNEALVRHCADLLAERGCLRRASDLVALMPDAARVRVMGRRPDLFADAANMGSIETALKSSAAEEAGEASWMGLACLARIHAFARGESERSLPEFARRHVCDAGNGALGALRSVRTFWDCYGLRSTKLSEAVADPVGEGAVADAAVEVDACGALGFDEARSEVDELLWLIGSAGLRGDGKAYLRHLKELRVAVAFEDGGLAPAVYAFHAALCGFAADKAEEVLSWLAPLLAAAWDPSLPVGTVGSVSCALLNAACAMASYLIEQPSTGKVASRSLDALRASRTFFEERGIEPGVDVVSFLEALCLLGSAGERQAVGLISRCQSRWSAQGNLMGQMLTSIALCVVNLTQDAVNQALVYARAGESIAQRLGLKQAAWVARLFESVAVIRGDNRPDIDRRLLEATLRQTSLHPSVSVALSLEVALLQAARGDVHPARDALNGVGMFARPVACRLLLVVVRALRRHKLCVLELLPRRLRTEYDALRPVPASRLYAGFETFAAPPGLLALPSSGKGLSICLLGGLKIEINGHPVSERVWGRRIARRLAIVLALFPGVPLTRESLVEALWGDRVATATVRNNLNTALSSLRASLGQKGGGPEYLVASGSAVCFNLDIVDVDILRFERLARTVLSRCSVAETAEVLDACSVLEQMFQNGFSSEFEGEGGRIRQRVDELTGLFVDCMLVGCDRARGEGDHSMAVWLARAALRAAPKRSDLETLLEESLEALRRQGASSSGEEDAVAPGGGEMQMTEDGVRAEHGAVRSKEACHA